MRKMASTVLKAGFALLLVAGLAQPAVADCSAPVGFGNLAFATWIQQDVTDPAAYWDIYMHEDPSINNGTCDLACAIAGFVVSDLGPFGIPGGFVGVFGDWAFGLGFDGCPLDLEATGDVPPILDNDEAHQVSVYGDSRGTTIIVNRAVQNNYDYDAAGPGGPLAVSTLLPSIDSATTDASVTVGLSWPPAAINANPSPRVCSITTVGCSSDTDCPFGEVCRGVSQSVIDNLVSGYRVMELRTLADGTTTMAPLDDTDSTSVGGMSTDTSATVVLASGADGSGETAVLFVNAVLAGGAILAPGTPSNTINLDPGLATPGDPRGKARGKGKGLKKVFPGNQR